MAGHDVYTAGSGNPGASNVARIAGWRWGMLAMVLDVLKGFLPTLAGVLILENYMGDEQARFVCYLIAAAAILGHVVPIKRKGGKGVATGGGAVLALFPVGGIVVVLIWVVAMKLTKLPVISSLVAAGLLCVWVGFDHTYVWEFTVVVLLFGVVVIRHVPNLRRLYNGDERGVTKEGQRLYQDQPRSVDE